MNFSKHPANLAIIIGGYVNGLGLVRSLAAQKRKIIIITTQPYDIAHHSKYVHSHLHVPGLDLHPERLSEVLLRHAGEWQGALVIPTNDEAIASLALSHETLAPWFRLAIPPLEAVPYILDKTKMLEAAVNIGMMTPECYGSAAGSVLSNPDLEFPVVVKPVRASEFSMRFGKKLFLARNSSELSDCCRLISEAGIKGEVFELIPGPDSRIYAYCVYMDRHGDPVAECTIRKLRQSPPFYGIARVAELTRNIPLLREQSIEFLRRTGFRGIAAAEFKQDQRDGTFRFFEINGRSVLYNSLLRQANLDVAGLIWDDYMEGGAKRVETREWPGVWIHLHADLLRTIQNFRIEHLSLGDYLAPYARKKTFAVWSHRDPAPFINQWIQSLKGFGSGLYKKISGRSEEGVYI